MESRVLIFKKTGLLAAGALIAALPLWGAKIAEVDFEQQGTVKLPKEQLLFNVQARPELDFSRDNLDEDVKRLYNTGNFADVVAETRELPNGTLKVLFKVKLKPRISLIEYRGNAKFRADELAKEVSLVRGGLLNDRQLRDSLNKLRKFYLDKGYRDATVSHSLLPDGDGEIILVFQVDERLRLRVHDVKFEGATLFSQRELRNSVANQFSYLNWVPFLNDYLNMGLLDRTELTRDKARLREHYHDKGYLDFKVKEIKLTPLKDDPEYVDITFVVEEGAPYKVGKITFEGNKIYKQNELEPLLGIHPEKIFSLAGEQGTVKGIGGLYDTLGYADASIKPVRKANFENHTVDVTFRIDEGRQYNVRDVVIVGNTATKDKVIRRELAIQPGDPVDRRRIDVSKQRLMGMGYFQKVEATAVGADALNEKDVQITVEEKEDRYSLRFGAGFSDVNSLAGMVELSTNNFDITNPTEWFYGGGQRFRIQGIYGIENAGFNVDFVEPWLFDIPLRLEVSGYLNEVEYENWNEQRLGGRFSLAKKFFDDFTTATVGYKFEYVRVTNVAESLKYYMKMNDLDGGFLVSQPSIMLDRDTRDNFLNPTSGYNLNLYGSVTPRFLGSSEDYFRLEAKGSYYYSFFDKAIIAMVGAKVGTVSGFGGGEVPIFERYFMGGSDSLRGFAYRTVSPTTENGDNIGGQSMLLITGEVTHPIYGPVRGAVFCDIGNVWSDAFSFGEINIGAGYGLRIQLPVLNAPIKLDLAYPVLNNQDHSSSKLRLHFNMGFTF